MQRLARPVVPALQQTVGEHGGIHRPRTRCTDAFDGKSPIFEQPVKDSPRKRTVHPAALQSECNWLLFAITGLLTDIPSHPKAP
ncbi:hypothetical protein CS8_098430 [Cupriavidus sp. 8B]